MIFTLFHLRTERVPPRQQFSFPIEKYGKLNKNNWKYRYRKSWFWYWIWCSYLFFCLDAKEAKDQDHICSFLLKEKNQKFKAASAELLRHFVSLCAPQTRCAQTATLRPLHSVPPLNAHQNEAGPIDNWELTISSIENWELKIENYFFHLPFINGTGSATVEAQRCCAS